MRKSKRSSGTNKLAEVGAAAWAKYIRELRERKGWTQKELAERIGCRYQTVQMWEYGKSKPAAMARRAIGEIDPIEG